MCAQPSLPSDWPGSGGGSGMSRLRPRGKALLCVLPRIYWVYESCRTTRAYPVGIVSALLPASEMRRGWRVEWRLGTSTWDGSRSSNRQGSPLANRKF